MRYWLALQIHDALLFEVRIEDLDWFIGDKEAGRPGVIDKCMTDMVDIWPSDLDGRRIKGASPLHMGVDVAVQLRWGVKLTRNEGLAAGLPERFLPAE
jgi:hypothetical protein